ncbi:hypothetical protein scyTo_0007885 [Scyliorhinus torazame]|uniref:HMG box domain-containing protein n=1 Tax=Scyliorhinus torazame TaxID=75743 RepID=A0A401P025_SCYTO|nr:hypothetical protein [Scyliorhinus torazame]
MDAPYDGAEITLVTEEIEGCYSCTKNFTPVKKKKWKEQSEDGSKKGKKPRPAYLLYYHDTHLKVQQDFPNLPRSEINKKISESWRRLSVAEKGIYLENAKLEKEEIDPSDKLISASSGIPPADIPGFRKILPRSGYIILPTSNLPGDGNSQQLAQSPTQRGGEGNATWQTLTHDTVQGLFTVSSTLADSGHIDSTEESIAIDGITDETFIHTETMQEIVTSEMLSQFSNSGDDKVAGELTTSETLIELTHPYDSPCVVIEGTLIGAGSDALEGVASCTSQQTVEANSVIAVLSNPSKPAGGLTSHKALGQAVGIDNKQGKELQVLNVRVECNQEKQSKILTAEIRNPLQSPNLVAELPKDSLTGFKVAAENGSPQTSAVSVKSVCLTLPKTNKASAFDLGLATCRGKGRCKNPKCSYVYMNRYKPGICPKCGYDFTRDKQDMKPSKLVMSNILSLGLLNPEDGLTQASKDLQRQTTLLLLRRTVQIPENEAELHEIFSLIQEMNSSRLILSTGKETITLEHNSWPNYFESSATICGLCDSRLFKGGRNSLAGPEKCWLLTESQFHVVIVQAKICVNPHCLALHNFTDISSGLFNIGNKLLVSLDLLFKIRNHIKLGEDPRDVTTPILSSVQKFTEKVLSDDQLNQLQELLWNGYWAFESLTIRDYNDMICGICGVVPKLEVAQRSPENILALKNVEFTWPDFPTSDEVNVEDFWSTMENEAIEQTAFPSSIPITKFDASIIAPFIPPLLRASIVVNSEKDKNPQPQSVVGNPRVLVRLLHDEVFKPEELNFYSEAELKNLLMSCDIPFHPNDSKDHLCSSLFTLYSYVLDGSTSQMQPPCDVTGGKVYKLCLHQVICGSKYLVRRESARDHVDLLVSSRYWPPVYVVDMAPHVALNADVRYPEIAGQIWGHNQGCFSDPLEPPKHVSCPELLDQHYTMDVTLMESSIQHPITKSNTRRIVQHDADQSSETNITAGHHSTSLCSELEPYNNVIKAFPDSKVHDVRQKSITFENATYYFLYNRLVDFLTSRDIVNQQINEVLQSCQPGEVVIRDSLYRLGIAHLNTESETEELA